jgi:diguanylate cyclase (GGDEF)-like protein
MTKLLAHRLLFSVLPALLVGGVLIHFHEALAAQIPGPSGLWNGILGFLAVAGVLLGVVFGQWRASLGILVITSWYFLTQSTDLATPAVTELATLTALLALIVLALLPERGPLGPAPTVLAGIVIIPSGMALRGLDASLHPLLTEPLLPWTLPLLEDIALYPATLLALLGILVISAMQLWRPDVVRASLLAAMVCLVPLTQDVVLTDQALLLSGAGISLVWLGLLQHAWELAFVDELTGLPNRRALELRLRRGQRPLVMVDVDNFKGFNDRWGHAAGDQVLRRVAEMLAQTGGGARAFRYGGEEFTLVFPSRPLGRIKALLEEARRKIFDHPFRMRSHIRDKRRRGQGGGKAIRISVSFGLAMPRRGEAVQETLRRADSALYRAKRNGRNRVEVSP